MKPLEDRCKVRDQHVMIQVSAAEKKQIREAAEKAGMTVSSYCRYELVYKKAEA